MTTMNPLLSSDRARSYVNQKNLRTRHKLLATCRPMTLQVPRARSQVPRLFLTFMHDSPTFLNILDVSLCIYTLLYISHFLNAPRIMMVDHSACVTLIRYASVLADL